MKKGKILGNIFKVNFDKALDNVGWNFLLYILGTYGFRPHRIGSVKFILYMNKASLLANRST